MSRLQNAADAAVVAGARELLKRDTTNFQYYRYDSLTDKYPGNSPAKDKNGNLIPTTAGDKVAEQYVVKNLGAIQAIPKKDANGEIETDAEGNTVIEKEIIVDNYSRGGDPEVTPKYSQYKSGANYYYVVQLEEDIHHFFIGFLGDMEAPVTAVARLAYNGIPHQGDDVEVNVKGTDILREMYKLADRTVIKNWEWQDHYKKDVVKKEVAVETTTLTDVEYIKDADGNYAKNSDGTYRAYSIVARPSEDYATIYKKSIYSKTWAQFQENTQENKWIRSSNKYVYKDNITYCVHWRTGSNYTSGYADDLDYEHGYYDHYRIENVTVEPKKNKINNRTVKLINFNKEDGTEDTIADPKKYSNDYNGRGENVDSLNLDFLPDLNGYTFTTDWDISHDPAVDTTPPKGKTLEGIQFNTGSARGSVGGFKYRIHATFNFETPYTVRNKRSAADKEDNPQDALFVRIESEPIKPLPFDKYKSDGTKADVHKAFSTVRQIILNINQSNMDPNYRPLVMFYTGPEKLNLEYDSTEGDDSILDRAPEVRDSQPVILNLNADARVILFAPHSPVVIRGNGHKMQGFVIAKKFVQLKTKEDYRNGEYEETTETAWVRKDKEISPQRYYTEKEISGSPDDYEQVTITKWTSKTKPNTHYYYYVEEEDTIIDRHGNVQTRLCQRFCVNSKPPKSANFW